VEYIFEVLKAILLGIVEGVTEWLPISSTGHMILFDEFIKLDASEEFKEMFFVVIQLGAILAVPIVFFDKLNPFSSKKSETEKKSTLSLWGKVIVGVIPAGIIGLLLDDFLDEHLYNSYVIAAMLIVYGIGFIIVERLKARGKSAFRVNDISDLTYRDAIIIGAFQTLSLIPGTSRSGATILGGMINGVSRTASAEFSFFMAIPIMLAASGLKLLKFLLGGGVVSAAEIGLLLIGCAVAFIVSVLVIKLLMAFVGKHSFTAFGIYRIILGAAVLLYFIAV
jgi:undecaprenyl-diphosphatase